MTYRLKLVLFSIICGTLLLADTAGAQSITIPATIKSQINRVVSKPLKSMVIDPELAAQNQVLVRTWVSGSINLKKAAKRESLRFKRKTFKQKSKMDMLRLPTERLKLMPKTGVAPAPGSQPLKPILLEKPRLQLAMIKKVRLQHPVTALYTEGRSYYRFLKFKEVPARSALKRPQAIAMAMKFLKDNKFIQETPDDRVGQIYLQSRLINREQPGGGGKDVLVQQDIVVQRQYQGRPVINSKIALGLHPDTKEILMFKHYNWTPVKTKVRNNRSMPLVKRTFRPIPETVITRRLQEKIRRTSGRFKRAAVKKVIPAWYQAGDQLIPVLVFDIAMQYSSPKGILKRDYLEVINLAGDDRQLLPNLTPSQKPRRAR